MTQNFSEKSGIAYLRWSTFEQGNCDRSSEVRQDAAINSYADHHGLKITTRLLDKGKSAYTGRNLSDGELGKLARRLNLLEIDPSRTLLIVEELDRLSRQPPGTMVTWITPLLNLGLTIVVAKTGQIITEATMNSDFGGFVQMMSQAFSANDFGRKQSDKGKASWSKRRAMAAEGELIARHRARGWLGWNQDTKRFDVIEERAWLVREMFALAEAGFGKATIAKILNQKSATDGRFRAFSSSIVQPAAWTAIAIKRIIGDRSVCGYVQFHNAPRGHDKKFPWAIR